VPDVLAQERRDAVQRALHGQDPALQVTTCRQGEPEQLNSYDYTKQWYSKTHNCTPKSACE
jgi:hypothetical protein